MKDLLLVIEIYCKKWKKIYLEYIIYVYLFIKVIINFNVKLNEYGIKLYFLKYV